MQLKEKIEGIIYEGCRYGDGSTSISEKVIKETRKEINKLIKDIKKQPEKNNFREGQIDSLMQIKDILK